HRRQQPVVLPFCHTLERSEVRDEGPPDEVEAVREGVPDGHLHQEGREADPDEDLGDQPRVLGDGARGDRARHGGGRGVPGARPAPHTLGALESDGRVDHALGTDRPVAAGAAYAGLAVRVAIAGGDAVGVPRAAGSLVVHGIPSVVEKPRPAHPYGRAGRLVPPGRCRTPGAPGRVSQPSRISTDSMTTSASGRSVRGLVCAEAMPSTTFWLAASVTSPKMVCLRVSHAVGATVMKNCEPLVPGPALAMASR